VSWQPIETAPKDGTSILTVGLNFGVEGRGQHFAVVEWCQDTRTIDQLTQEGGTDFSGWYDSEDDEPLLFLTHWMPLPPPPTEAESAND
jgi:hypothetical protein